MGASFIPFARPRMSGKEAQNVFNCLKSGWLSTGPMCAELESKFETMLGVKAVATSSATSGFQTLFMALDLKPGDEVIFPVLTFSSPLMVAYQMGLKPVVVDVEPENLFMCPNEVEKHITEKTRAIVLTHLGGAAANMTSYKWLAMKNDLYLIEDAAHALPSAYPGNYDYLVGADPKVTATVYSFYATKTMTTGEGGMVATHNEELARKCKQIRLHGMNANVRDRNVGASANGWFYDIERPGIKANLPDVLAAIGLAQFETLFQARKKREDIARAYVKAFDPSMVTYQTAEYAAHSWHLFIVRFNTEEMRDAFREYMREAKIGCSLHFIPMHYHSFWREYLGKKEGDYPIAEDAYKRMISLPIYSSLTAKQVKYICDTIKAFKGE
jgi:dTDP-4-amino-4,6-dideoxygalactose transaminase